MNGTYLKMHQPRRTFNPSSNFDKIDAFFYHLDYSALNNQIVINNDCSKPCTPERIKTAENILFLKPSNEKMSKNSKLKENIPIKTLPIKQQITPSLQWWPKN